MKRLIVAAILAASATTLTRPAQAGDPEAGKQVFKSICNLCHEAIAGKNRVGPSLYGVVGRHSGTVPGFNYSDANKASNLVWTVDVLSKYLADPQKIVPGTKMTYAGLKDDQKRADLIAYLSTLH
jgi:cytochrome c2